MSNFPKPLFQSEAKCKAIGAFARKVVDFHCALIFKVRVFGTWKWPVNFFTLNCTGIIMV